MTRRLCNLLFLGGIMAVATGCGSTAQSGALLRMQEHFLHGEYSKSIEDIQRARNYAKLPPAKDASTRLSEALSYDMLGNHEKADEIYHQIIAKFPNTSFALRAHARLERMEGDQKELVVPVFDERAWQVASRQWNGNSFTISYVPANAKWTKEAYTVTSVDRGPNMVAPEAFLTLFISELKLHCPEAVAHREPSQLRNFYFSFHTGNCADVGKEHGIGRIVFTETRAHTILYTAPLSVHFNTDEWMQRLGKISTTNSPSPPSEKVRNNKRA